MAKIKLAPIELNSFEELMAAHRPELTDWLGRNSTKKLPDPEYVDPFDYKPKMDLLTPGTPLEDLFDEDDALLASDFLDHLALAVYQLAGAHKLTYGGERHLELSPDLQWQPGGTIKEYRAYLDRVQQFRDEYGMFPPPEGSITGYPVGFYFIGEVGTTKSSWGPNVFLCTDKKLRTYTHEPIDPEAVQPSMSPAHMAIDRKEPKVIADLPEDSAGNVIKPRLGWLIESTPRTINKCSLSQVLLNLTGVEVPVV